MQIGACGMACGVCDFLAKGACPGCAAGTDPAAIAQLEAMTEDEFVCPTLTCAIQNRVDYCLRCEQLPCKTLYREEMPYSKRLLKEGLEKLRARVDAQKEKE